MALIDDLIEYYTNLLIIQYNNRPKARATISAIADEILASAIYFDVRDGYDVETAVGIQLDVIGKYVNLDRYYRGQDFDGYFDFIIYDEVDAPPATRTGFSDYTDFETKDGEFLTYPETLSDDLVLNDADFRFLIKLRIIQNNSNHSNGAIDASVYEFFGDDVRPSSAGNMIMDYFISTGLLPLATVASQKGVLPKPAGVRLGYFIEQDEPFFGFSTYSGGVSDNITGFANYSDYDTKEGDLLRNLNLLEV